MITENTNVAAYRRGQCDYRNGVHTNPYRHDEPSHQDWWDGYQTSQADSAPERHQFERPPRSKYEWLDYLEDGMAMRGIPV